MDPKSKCPLWGPFFSNHLAESYRRWGHPQRGGPGGKPGAQGIRIRCGFWTEPTVGRRPQAGLGCGLSDRAWPSEGRGLSLLSWEGGGSPSSKPRAQEHCPEPWAPLAGGGGQSHGSLWKGAPGEPCSQQPCPARVCTHLLAGPAPHGASLTCCCTTQAAHTQSWGRQPFLAGFLAPAHMWLPHMLTRSGDHQLHTPHLHSPSASCGAIPQHGLRQAQTHRKLKGSHKEHL